MRSRLSGLTLCCLAVTACRVFADSDFPASAQVLVPPPQYRIWWEVVESCAGRTAPFDAVSWFSVPPTELVVRGEMAAGAWFVSRNRVAIVDGWVHEGPLVRHEMLHAILRDGKHASEYFQERCADEVACGRDCVAGAPLSGAIEVGVDVLEVDAVLYPLAPSLSEHEGKATLVVRVRNPTHAAVFVPGERFGEARCAVGFLIATVLDPDLADLDCGYLGSYATDGRVYFRPGETRRLLFEVDLRVPAYGLPFHAGAITVSAIFADNVRKTTLATIRP